jgi:hypothetical protein
VTLAMDDRTAPPRVAARRLYSPTTQRWCTPTKIWWVDFKWSLYLFIDIFGLKVTYCGSVEQDVLCINERQVMVRSRGMYDQSAPNVSLEGVEADLAKR